ncbi:MAG: hypothetical protein GC154_10270 [bacterium]|nr:hypothetical protein [bacterium]
MVKDTFAGIGSKGRKKEQLCSLKIVQKKTALSNFGRRNTVGIPRSSWVMPIMKTAHAKKEQQPVSTVDSSEFLYAALADLARLLDPDADYRGVLDSVAQSLIERLGIEFVSFRLRNPGDPNHLLQVEAPHLGRPRLSYAAYSSGSQPSLSLKASNTQSSLPIQWKNEVVGECAWRAAANTPASREALRALLETTAQLLAYDWNVRRRLASEPAPRHEHNALDALIASSGAMQAVKAEILRAARSNGPVLIQGEVGSGKEFIARLIHQLSGGDPGTISCLPCADLTEAGLSSCLTEQDDSPRTIYLTGVEHLAPETQARLAQWLETRAHQNGSAPRSPRVIASTQADLAALVRVERFRQDAFYRLNIHAISVPPLRDRREDLLFLTERFIEEASVHKTGSVGHVSAAVMEALSTYPWPGNVRELKTCLEHAVRKSGGHGLHVDHLPLALQMPGSSDPSQYDFTARVNQLEKDMLLDALKITNGNITAAARRLGITSRMVRYKIQRLGLEDHWRLTRG